MPKPRSRDPEAPGEGDRHPCCNQPLGQEGDTGLTLAPRSWLATSVATVQPHPAHSHGASWGLLGQGRVLSLPGHSQPHTGHLPQNSATTSSAKMLRGSGPWEMCGYKQKAEQKLHGTANTQGVPFTLPPAPPRPGSHSSAGCRCQVLPALLPAWQSSSGGLHVCAQGWLQAVNVRMKRAGLSPEHGQPQTSQHRMGFQRKTAGAEQWAAAQRAAARHPQRLGPQVPMSF